MTEIQAKSICKSAGIKPISYTHYVGKAAVEITAHCPPTRRNTLFAVLEALTPSGHKVIGAHFGNGDHGANVQIDFVKVVVRKTAAKKKPVAKKKAAPAKKAKK